MTELGDIRARKLAQEQEVDKVENTALRCKFNEILNNLRIQEHKRLQRVSPYLCYKALVHSPVFRFSLGQSVERWA